MADKIDYLNSNEIKAILRTIDSTRDRAIILLSLYTGLFMKELIDLKITDIDWETKKLLISGNRAREINIKHEQTFDALIRWSRERPETPLDSLFITSKGKANKVTGRNLDHIIRKYSKLARIKRTVNFQILKNTFIIQLFKDGKTSKEVATILGIVDRLAISRYKKAALSINETETPLESITEIDTRSRTNKIINKIFPTEPKVKEATVGITIPLTVNPEENVFGRDKEINNIISYLNNNRSVLLTGALGVGQTHLLKYISKTYNRPTVYIGSPKPVKQMLQQICKAIDPDYESLMNKPTAATLLNFITKNSETINLVLIIDNLDRLRISDLDILLTLIKDYTILGAVTDIADRLKQLWWKFQLLELKPLGSESSKQLIKYLTRNLTIKDYKLLETKLLDLSNGYPLAITDMIHSLNPAKIVSEQNIRDLYHEGGTTYRSWGWIIIVLWGAMTFFRFLALGTHDFESYILAGMGMSALMMARHFIRKMN